MGLGGECLGVAYSMIQSHEFFMITSDGNKWRGEGVSVAADGDFICVMFNTEKNDSVLWVRDNFNSFLAAINEMCRRCETLATARKSYLSAITWKAPVA